MNLYHTIFPDFILVLVIELYLSEVFHLYLSRENLSVHGLNGVVGQIQDMKLQASESLDRMGRYVTMCQT